MSPVPVEALRRGEVGSAPTPGSYPARVLAFLRKRSTQAWRARELADELDIDQHTLGAVLRRLRVRGLVDKQGAYWFALGDRESAQLAAAIATTLAANDRLGPEDPSDWAHLEHE